MGRFRGLDLDRVDHLLPIRVARASCRPEANNLPKLPNCVHNLAECRGVAALPHELPDGRAYILMIVLKPALHLRRARGAVEVEVLITAPAA